MIRNLADILAMLGVLSIIFLIIARIISGPVINLGLIKIRAMSGLILANSLTLIAILMNLFSEEEAPSLYNISREKIFFLLVFIALILLLVNLSNLLVSTVRSYRLKHLDQLYRKIGDSGSQFLGVVSMQHPCDNWMMQEIICEVKPDFIIETGTHKGGMALFYATILEKVNKAGKVITIDIDPQVEEASKFEIFKKSIEVLKGNSVSSEIIDMVEKLVKNQKALVTLDSLHTKEHVLKELELYSRFVSLNSYIVIQDGTGFREVAEAIKEFLKINKNFKIDCSKEKYLITNYESGFLKRVK